MKSIAPHSAGTVRPKTCVIFPGALGDFICFLPALQALGQTDLFARSEFAELAPDGVAVHSLERSEIGSLFRPEAGHDAAARRLFGAYEAVYSWFASANQEFVSRLQAVTGGRAQIFPFRPVRAAGHQADYYLGCVNERAVSSTPPAIALRAVAVDWCEDYWTQHALRRRPVLVIAPGSGAREKNWPEEFFLVVTQWWREATGGNILLLVGPVERERDGIERLRDGCKILGDLSLSQVAAVLSRSSVYLGNDSGISHLAAAVGVRTVALFGPSNDRQWAPRGKKVVVVRRNLQCSACRHPAIKNDFQHNCLTTLLPTEIIATLEQLPEVVILTR